MTQVVIFPDISANSGPDILMDFLIIDDEEIVRRTLQRYIEHRGGTPYLAEN
ncbi:uncharacterized protein METZ01_LOCUS447628, partial [marine metagenome]